MKVTATSNTSRNGRSQWPTHPISLRLLLTLGVSVTQGRGAHVTQPDCPFATAVHEGVAVVGMELSCCDHLRELLHVGRLDVHDIWHRRVKEGDHPRERGWGWGWSGVSDGITGLQCHTLALTLPMVGPGYSC